MCHPNFFILYVDNPLNSAVFYTSLLGKSPQETHPTFVSYDLDSGVKLGLWSKHTAQPTPIGTTCGNEIAFSVEDIETVDLTYSKWTRLGGRVAQKPISMDFGYTFVVLDPDGHRLRVFYAND